MKIGKAVEKIKQQKARQDATSNPAHAADVRSEAIKDHWSPPVYTQSRCMSPCSWAADENRCVCLNPDAPEIEDYKILRTKIEQLAKLNRWNTIMITSVRPGEGKTLTSINLALTFAKSYNQTVLLLDCDLRQQGVVRYLGIVSDSGIVDYLVDGKPLKDLIIWPGIDKLTLVSGGRIVMESAELLASPRMKALMAEMKQRYEDRYIIVDSPPLMSGADTLALVPLVDAIVMVVESGGTALKDIQDALELIPKEKFLGFVMNKHTSRNNGYYRYYGSSKG
jgi:protein-tyrosine kinase